jgi:hypothetical protein
MQTKGKRTPFRTHHVELLQVSQAEKRRDEALRPGRAKAVEALQSKKGSSRVMMIMIWQETGLRCGSM